MGCLGVKIEGHIVISRRFGMSISETVGLVRRSRVVFVSIIERGVQMDKRYVGVLLFFTRDVLISAGRVDNSLLFVHKGMYILSQITAASIFFNIVLKHSHDC